MSCEWQQQNFINSSTSEDGSTSRVSRLRSHSRAELTAKDAACQTIGPSVTDTGFKKPPAAMFAQEPGKTLPPYKRSHDTLFELKLLHHASRYTCQAYASDFIVELGLMHDFCLNATFAFASLHLSSPTLTPDQDQRSYFRSVSASYYERALQGNRQALQSLNQDNAVALFMSTLYLSNYMLISSGQPADELDAYDPMVKLDLLFQWFRFTQSAQLSVFAKTKPFLPGGLFSEDASVTTPTLLDMDDAKYLNGGPPWTRKGYCLGSILEWAKDSKDTASLRDREAYSSTVSYIGRLYHASQGHPMPSIATIRRIMEVPIHCPPRFLDLMEQGWPRALVILAHLLALFEHCGMKEADVWWVHGISESHNSAIEMILPSEWRTFLPRAASP